MGELPAEKDLVDTLKNISARLKVITWVL